MQGDFEVHELPSGVTVYYRDSDHSYFDRIEERPGDKWVGPNASRLPSPSTVAKVYDLQLADRLSAAAARAGLEWFERKDRRATEGTNVHEKVLEILAAGERVPSLADVSEAERGYAQGVIAWWAEVEPEPIATEQVVYSPIHRFAGRLDLIATIDGKRTIVDLKTGFIGESAHVQLGGYWLAATESGFGPIDEMLLLKVYDDGSYSALSGLATPTDFTRALNVYREAKKLGKGVREQMKAAQEARDAAAEAYEGLVGEAA